MTPVPKSESRLAKLSSPFLVVVFLVAVAAFVAALVTYAWWFPGPISSEPQRWAAFGDFLGGTLGALFGLLGLLALLVTIVLQSHELRNSTRELANSVRALEEQGAAVKLQNFERTFFEMVRLHNDIVRTIERREPGRPPLTVGRDCFRALYDEFKGIHGTSNAKLTGQGQARIIIDAYDTFHSRYQHEVGHYFRNLYRTLKLVDESHVNNKNDYTGILRAQLSSFELTLLFYNALHPVGQKMKSLVERYKMLENLNVGLLCNPPDERPLVEPSAFGDQAQPA